MGELTLWGRKERSSRDKSFPDGKASWTQTLRQEVALKECPFFFRVRGLSSSALAGHGHGPGVER